MDNGMQFLNGWKSILGAAGLIASVVFPHVAPDTVGQAVQGVDTIAQGVFGTLFALGLIHKAEKAKAK